MILWKTGHVFNETVLSAFSGGFRKLGEPAIERHVSLYDGRPGPSLSYGFLRGVDQIYRDCQAAGVDWWNVDKGFFRAEHFGGYYRIGHRGLQPVFRQDVEVDPSRWETLGIPVVSWRHKPDGHVLVCPPSGDSAEFYNVNVRFWTEEAQRRLPARYRNRVVVRRKGDPRALYEMLKDAYLVVVYNSNTAMEALAYGIPAIAETGIVRSWNGLRIEQAAENLTRFDRVALFRYAAWCQFTLEEARSGLAWKATREVQK